MPEPGSLITWVADFASIASLAVSFYVAWQVKGIKRRFVSRFAISSLIQHLRKHTSALSKLISAPGSDNVSVVLIAELSRCEANLKHATPHLDGSSLSYAQEVLPLVALRPPDLPTIYGILIRLQQSLENAAAEQEASEHVK